MQPSKAQVTSSEQPVLFAGTVLRALYKAQRNEVTGAV